MSESVNLPALGESVTEGTVTRWLKKVGDHVDVDEPLLEVSTDKVDTEIPSPVAGIIEAILVQEDETVEVGTALVTIGTGDGAAAPAAPAAEPAAAEPAVPASPYVEPNLGVPEPAPAPAAPAPAPSAPAMAPPPTGAPANVPPPAPAAPPIAPPAAAAPPAVAPPVAAPPVAAPVVAAAPAAAVASPNAGYVTPLVRKLANEKGVDLESLSGTGVGGRIRKQDVLDAIAGAPAATAAPAAKAAVVLETSPLRGTTVPMTRLRKVVAQRAVESMNSTAQLTTVVEVDVTLVARYRDQVKAQFQAKTGTKLSFLPFFALATAEALKAFPIINSTVDGDTIVYPPTENISIAVDTERGLLTPVIRDAGTLNLAGFAAQIADLADRTRNNTLKPDELSGGTFTLTNTGSRGALFDTPVVFLPQSAILGTGIVVKKPVVVTNDGLDSIAIRSTVFLALSYDHRIIDGADAARFLTAVKDRLEAGNFAANLGI
jgi:pyruvate dehydrogenase E2 component (dihydrolipoamide acetyltransferase)